MEHYYIHLYLQGFVKRTEIGFVILKHVKTRFKLVFSYFKYDEIRTTVFGTILKGIRHMSRKNQLMYN